MSSLLAENSGELPNNPAGTVAGGRTAVQLVMAQQRQQASKFILQHLVYSTSQNVWEGTNPRMLK